MQWGGGGGREVSVANGRKVCIGVLSSDEIGLCGSERDWISTACSECGREFQRRAEL